MDWISANRIKSVLVVLLGIVTGLGLFVYDGFSGFASDPALATEDVGSALAARTDAEVQDSVRAYLEQRAKALQAADIADEERRQAEAELEAELRDLERDPTPPPLEIPSAVSPALPDDMFQSILLVGTDASGYLADTIIDVLLPSDGSTPLIVSIPRDLYVGDACTHRYQRINASMGGCPGVAGGPDLLALNVQAFTGIKVDHYARVSFAGFSTVVDRLGGAQVCVGDLPIRDLKSGLALAAGCQHADGAQTLAWVRSRNPEVYKDGQWVKAPGSDFDRQRKQQEILFQLADVLSSYSSVGALTGALQNLASAVRMDSGFSVAQAASIGFRYRGIGPGDVTRLSIQVSDYTTSAGAQVLIPTRTFNADLAAKYPAAGR